FRTSPFRWLLHRGCTGPAERPGSALRRPAGTNPDIPIACLFFKCSNAIMISTSTAADVARGVNRLLMQEGFSPILEFTLANGRRLDVAALGPDGLMLGVEIK